MAVLIELASPLLPEVGELIRASDAYAASLYPAESNHLVDVEALAQPNVIFCVARLDDAVAGCGAAVLMPEGYAEIKRMFVSETARGHGIGRQILALSAVSRSAGRLPGCISGSSPCSWRPWCSVDAPARRSRRMTPTSTARRSSASR